MSQVSPTHQTGVCAPFPAPSSGLGTSRLLGGSGWCELPRSPLPGVLRVAEAGTALLAVIMY